MFSLSIAVAQDDHERFPDDALLIFEGINPVDRTSCFLFVTSIDYVDHQIESSKMRLTAKTSFQHGADSAPIFILQQVPGREEVMSGQSGSSQLSLQFADSRLDFSSLQKYVIRWLHGNHFHNGQCINLKEHQHDHEQ